MRTLSAIGMLAALVLVLPGCYAKSPLGTGHAIETQRKMMSAAHWDILADDVAEQVAQAMEVREDLLYLPVYVKPPNDSAFSRGFHSLVISHMVARGLQVSVEEEDTLLLEYQVQGVSHSRGADNSIPPGTFTALPLGILVARNVPGVNEFLAAATLAGLAIDFGRGFYAGQPPTEIIITSKLHYNNRFVVHDSSIYYLDDVNMDNYREFFQDESWRPRTLQVVNR